MVEAIYKKYIEGVMDFETATMSNGFYKSLESFMLDEGKLASDKEILTFILNTGKRQRMEGVLDVTTLPSNYDGYTILDVLGYFVYKQYYGGPKGIDEFVGFAYSVRKMYFIDYLLRTSLCYVELFTGVRVEKFYATRNLDLLAAYGGYESDAEAGLKYGSYLTMTNSEVGQGFLRLIKVSENKQGYKLTQPRASVSFIGNIKVTPLSIMMLNVNLITDKLSGGVYKFKYMKDNLHLREMTTTINPTELLMYYSSGQVGMMLDNAQASFDKGTIRRGYISLPEIGLPKNDTTGTRALNLTRIVEVVPVEISEELVNGINTDYVKMIEYAKILIDVQTKLENLKTLYRVYLDREYLGVSQDLEVIRLELKMELDKNVKVGSTAYLRYLDGVFRSQKRLKDYVGFVEIKEADPVGSSIGGMQEFSG